MSQIAKYAIENVFPKSKTDVESVNNSKGIFSSVKDIYFPGCFTRMF